MVTLSSLNNPFIVSSFFDNWFTNFSFLDDAGIEVDADDGWYKSSFDPSVMVSFSRIVEIWLETMLGLRGYACTCQNYLDNYRCIRDRKAQCMQPQNILSYSDLDMSILPLPSSRCKHGDCFEKSLPTSHPLPLHQSWVLPYLYHGWPSLPSIRFDSRMHDCLFRQKYSFSICNNRLTKLSTRFFLLF